MYFCLRLWLCVCLRLWICNCLRLWMGGGGGDGFRYKPIRAGTGKKIIPAAGMGEGMGIALTDGDGDGNSNTRPAPPRPVCIPSCRHIWANFKIKFPEELYKHFWRKYELTTRYGINYTYKYLRSMFN